MARQLEQWGQSLIPSWKALPLKQQEKFLGAIDQAFKAEKITFVDNNHLYDAVYEVITGYPTGADRENNDRLRRQFLATVIPNEVSDPEERKKTKRDSLRPTLFWLAYYYPVITRECLQTVNLQFEAAPLHPNLPEPNPKYAIPTLGLVDPTDREDEAQPHLLMQFWARKTRHVGHRDKLEELQRFLEPEPDRAFKWWQIAGEAGQGKSRLAVELFRDLPKESIWEYGFVSRLDDDFLSRVRAYRPSSNLLIVIDYASAPVKVRRLLDLIETLEALGNSTGGKARIIRLLLIDRQPYLIRLEAERGKGIWELPGIWQSELSYASEWHVGRSTLHGRRELPPVLLGGLESNDLISIAFDWVAARHKTLTAEVENRIRYFLKVPAEDERVEPETSANDLQLPQRAKRPLTAILAAEIALNDVDPPLDEITDPFEYLLGAVLDDEAKQLMRPEGMRGLSAAAIQNQETSKIQNIMACYANIVGSYNVFDEDYFTPEGTPLFSSDERDIERARILLGFNVPLEAHRLEQGRADLIAREPDLLAEYQVLRQVMKPSLRPTLLAATSYAWSRNPQAAFEFILRLVQDFPRHAGTTQLLSIRPEPQYLNDWLLLVILATREADIDAVIEIVDDFCKDKARKLSYAALLADIMLGIIWRGGKTENAFLAFQAFEQTRQYLPQIERRTASRIRANALSMVVEIAFAEGEFEKLTDLCMLAEDDTDENSDPLVALFKAQFYFSFIKYGVAYIQLKYASYGNEKLGELSGKYDPEVEFDLAFRTHALFFQCYLHGGEIDMAIIWLDRMHKMCVAVREAQYTGVFLDNSKLLMDKLREKGRQEDAEQVKAAATEIYSRDHDLFKSQGAKP